MHRLHLLEFGDLAWWPTSWRDAGTAYLTRASEITGHANGIAAIVAETLARTGEVAVLDLCSGAGGPAATLIHALPPGGPHVTVRLSDRFPNVDALQRIADGSGGHIQVVAESVDATDVPGHLPGLRTLFNSFHHFPPDVASRILASAVRNGRPILVVELTGRDPLLLLAAPLNALAFAALLPFLRPRLDWLMWTYLIPVLPLWVMFDGIVSCLRTYTPTELRDMTDALDAPGWHWTIRTQTTGVGPDATVLIGLPPVPG